MNILVSIIVPCYNQAQYLDDSLESVLNQTYKNWECIIVNDGSKDDTEKISKYWLEKDSRFKYFFIENSGVSIARNIGISNGKGVFVLPLDADDKISFDYVELAINAFTMDKALKLVYCKAEMFGDIEGEWNLEPYSIKGLAQNNMIFCSAIYRKEDWQLVGGYDSNMKSGIEDWEFWISLLKFGGKVKCLDTVGFYYRIKKISRQKLFKNSNQKEVFEYMSIKHADFFVTQLGSFQYLNQVYKIEQRDNRRKLKSKKFVLDLFCKTFFGFVIFGRYIVK